MYIITNNISISAHLYLTNPLNRSEVKSLDQLQIHSLLALLMQLPLILVVGKLEPHLVVVFYPQQLLLAEPRL